MQRIGTILILLLLTIAIALNVGTSQLIANANIPEKCDERCWYVKYKREQRRSAGLKKKNRQLQRYRSIVRRSSQLTRSIIPWVGLAQCESGNRWKYNGSSGFHGGIQFSPSTWRAYGGTTFSRYAWQATPIQQVAIGQKVLVGQGRGAWPGCSRKGAW